MRKDGTMYLAKIQFQNNQVDWDIISWDEPVGLSCDSSNKKWVNRAGFALKIKTVLEFYIFDEVLEKLRNK
jgi:hypothetical protein